MSVVLGALLGAPDGQFFDDDGHPLTGGKLSFYLTGTSTPADTFADAALAVPNANPVILDAAGRATIYLAAAGYKVICADADDVPIWTRDPVTGVTV